MTPVTFYSKHAAAYAADAAYPTATYRAYGVLKDLGVEYAGVLVQCQIIASYKELL